MLSFERRCCRPRRLVGCGSLADRAVSLGRARLDAAVDRHLDLVRETGALTALPFVLTTRIRVLASFGDLDAAASLEEELRAATEATGIAPGPYGALSLAPRRGHEAGFTKLIRTAIKEAEARGEGLALTFTERLRGALYNGLGRYDAALAAVAKPSATTRRGRRSGR